MSKKLLQNRRQNKHRLIVFGDENVSTGHVNVSAQDTHTLPSRVETIEELKECILAGGRKWNFPVFEVDDYDNYLRIFFECGLKLDIPLFNGYDLDEIDVRGIIDDIGYIGQEIGNQYHRDMFGVWGGKIIKGQERYELYEKAERFLGKVYRYAVSLRESVIKLWNFDDEDKTGDTSTGFVSNTHEPDGVLENKCRTTFKYGGEELNVYVFDETPKSGETFRSISIIPEKLYENLSEEEKDRIVKVAWAYAGRANVYMENIEITEKCQFKTYGNDKDILEINGDAFKRNFKDIGILYPTWALASKKAEETHYGSVKFSETLKVRVTGTCAGIEFVMERLAFDQTLRKDGDQIDIEVVPTDGIPRYRTQFSTGVKGYAWGYWGNDNITYVLSEDICEKYVDKGITIDVSNDVLNMGIKDIRYKIDPMAWWNTDKDLNITITNNTNPVVDKIQYVAHIYKDDVTLHIDVQPGSYPVMSEKVDESWYYEKGSLFGNMKQPVMNIRTVGKWEYDTVGLYLDINTSVFEVGEVDFGHFPGRGMKINGQEIEYNEYTPYPMDNFKRKVQKELRKDNVYIKRRKVRFPDEKPKDILYKDIDY